jgi:hypothetical protein
MSQSPKHENTPILAYSPKAFQRAYSVGHTKLYAEIKTGRLIVRKLGHRTLIDVAEAQRWFENLPVGGAA